ncbi:MAG: 16S rRNA (cytidine(1402)-2'-O)-methyltransferase [Gallionella sp.]|nr:16S rRNA (cytidine(1402)-2'-O)-methyltransferase [Gallionella sp.]
MHHSTPQSFEPALYVVATPLGNLRDITLRALDVLAAADVIAAEDTRNTRHLLTQHGISPQRLLALHQHNERAGADKVIALLREGLRVAFVSDAGTPAVSDPGALLVRAVIDAGLRVIPIPGPSALVAALSASGLATPQVLFYGFLPNKAAARSKVLQDLREREETLVFYEAPHRVLECVEDMRAILGGEREIVLARELTKLFEELHRCPLADAPEWLRSDANHQRGEFVLLVSGAESRKNEVDARTEQMLRILLGELPLKQAVQLAVQISGVSRNVLYPRALAINTGVDAVDSVTGV